MGIRRSSYAFIITVVVLTFYLRICGLTDDLTRVVKEPYMDEKFHVPQAQLYCKGNWTHSDPKITSPRGLYALTHARMYLRDIMILKEKEVTCDLISLRRTNQLVALFTCVTLILIQLSFVNYMDFDPNRRVMGFFERIARSVDRSTKLHLFKIILTSMSIALLPPLFSLHLLYYPDGGSLLFVMLAYLWFLNDLHLFAAVAGIVAVMFRQTNIVWLLYLACLTAIKTIENFNRQMRAYSNEKRNGINPEQYPILNFPFFTFIRRPELIKDLIWTCLPYALPLISFMLWNIRNGRIVLGDQEADPPTLHVAQVLYFLLFCGMFGASWIFTKRTIRLFFFYVFRRPLTLTMVSILCATIISIGRYAHPFLSDKRHLMSHLWRHLLGLKSFKPYCLIPVYLQVSLGIFYHMRPVGPKKMILFMTCTILSVIFNGMIEPRHFIIPFVFIRLSVRQSMMEHILELLEHTTCDIGMYLLFIYNTYKFDGVAGQRVTW